MRTYVIDCSGDVPVATGKAKVYLKSYADFGMNGGDYGPPNYLTLANGNRVVVGNSYANGSSVFIFVVAPDGTIVSKTYPTVGDVYFTVMFLSPDDPFTVSVVCGDFGIYEISALDTASPVVTFRDVGFVRLYPLTSSSPYYDGPGVIDTAGETGDAPEVLWGFNTSTFKKTQVGPDDSFDQWWPNGAYDLGDGRVIGFAWGKNGIDDADWKNPDPNAPYSDAYTRLFAIDYRTNPPTVEQFDIKPKELLPDLDQNVTGGNYGRYKGFMNVDELGVGSTSVSIAPERGLVVRGSTVLSDRWSNDAEDGERYSVAVWTVRGTPSKGGQPMPPRALPIRSQEFIGDPLPLGDEVFVSMTGTTSDGNWPRTHTNTWQVESLDPTHRLVVGSTPTLTSNDDETYLQSLTQADDPYPVESGTYNLLLGAKIAPLAAPLEADPDLTLAYFDVTFRYYISATSAAPPRMPYSQMDTMLTKWQGTESYSDADNNGGPTYVSLSVSASAYNTPAEWQTATQRISKPDTGTLAMLESGDLMIGLRTYPSIGYDSFADMRLSFAEIRPVYYRAP